VNGLEEEFGATVEFYRLDAALPENGSLQQTYGVRGHPSVLILDSDGNVAARYFGVETAETLRTALLNSR
jgi:hypothetical protein